MTEEIELKYQWRKTWPDKENDFVGSDRGETIGRFYHHQAAEGMRWYWHMQWGDNGRERVTLSGLRDTPREAAREIEKNYDELKAIYARDTAGEQRS